FSVKINIPPDENCYAKINAICQDGSHSNLEAVSPDFISLILDLIVNGYQSNENAVQCATQVQSCSFPNLPNVTHSFRVIKPPYIRKFGIKYTGGDPQYEVYLFGHNGTEGPIWIRCENGVDPNPNRCGALDHLEIWFNNNGVPQKMGEFDCSFTTNFLNINVEVNVQNFPDCQVQYLSKNNPFTPAPPTDPNTIERDETGAEFRQSAAVAPNPFSDQLDVYLAFPNKTVANVQLVNLGGQIVVNELLQAGQEKFSLPTTHIAAGFYLLRVEADGVKQTFKVVKTE
ncbi:MAG: T9SS type A sorting domain-containing protein, partial [Saprospiraceae bacterium]|nr:T9SS type A sorting domain-containing protein [Saprospiraceae bacterium]